MMQAMWFSTDQESEDNTCGRTLHDKILKSASRL